MPLKWVELTPEEQEREGNLVVLFKKVPRQPTTGSSPTSTPSVRNATFLKASLICGRRVPPEVIESPHGLRRAHSETSCAVGGAHPSSSSPSVGPPGRTSV
jgi:hypothetical protein